MSQSMSRPPMPPPNPVRAATQQQRVQQSTQKVASALVRANTPRRAVNAAPLVRGRGVPAVPPRPPRRPAAPVQMAPAPQAANVVDGFDDFDDFGFDDYDYSNEPNGGGNDDFDPFGGGGTGQNSRMANAINRDKSQASLDLASLDQLRGHIVNIKKYNDWATGKLSPEDGGHTVTVVGEAISELQRGDAVVLYGKHSTHPRYGPQFQAELSTPDTTSVMSLVRYLERNFKNVGRRSAQVIVKYYQDMNQIETLRNALIHNPTSLDLEAITGRKGIEIQNDDRSINQRVRTSLALSYSQLGIRGNVIGELSRELVAEISSYQPAELELLVKKLIEEQEAKKDKAKDNVIAPVPPPVPSGITQRAVQAHVNPTPAASEQKDKLTDEQYVGQIIAEYEARNNMPISGYVPKSVSPEVLARAEKIDAQMREDQAKKDQAPIKETEVDAVHAARAVFKADPYKYVGEIAGYTFNAADTIGLFEGVGKDEDVRVFALVSYATKIACEAEGHSYVNAETLKEAISHLDRDIVAQDALNRAHKAGRLDEENGRYYPKGLLAKEKRLAKAIADRVAYSMPPLANVSGEVLESLIDKAEYIVGVKKNIDGFTLDPTQRDALRGILTSTSGIHCLVGGAGRGKTAIVQVLMETLNLTGQEMNPVFCAPVGKAAKVLQSQIKDYGNASTIHSTLGARGTGYFFEKDKDNPLECNLLVADETSMLGLELGTALFDATPAKSHIIMLGDPNQLSPIDAGNVLKSLLEIDGVDTHTLTVPHRNQGEILKMVDKSVEGLWAITPDQIEQAQAFGDVKLHNQHDSLHVSKIPAFIDKVALAVEEYGGAEHVGVICPMRQGTTTKAGWNVTYLNEAIREKLNPDESGAKKIEGSNLRRGDRVIITRNMSVYNAGNITSSPHFQAAVAGSTSAGLALLEEFQPKEEDDENIVERIRVVNGDTGELSYAIMGEVDGAKQAVGMVVRLDDDRHVLLADETKNNLGLAYAITVHAAQGSEYKKTFGLVTKGYSGFMHRSLVMTMLSRARESLEVYGATQDVATIIARKAPKRNCGITERVESLLDLYEEREQDSHTHEAAMRPSAP